jgi:hypothetical protein
VVARREVRVTQFFFDRLDELFPAERGASGEPSATDFLLHEIPAIIDRLAIAFESSTTPVDDDPRIRMLITAGVLVEFIAVYVELAPDDAVEIIYLEVDTQGGSLTRSGVSRDRRADRCRDRDAPRRVLH